jgi:hypothetical protein
MSDRIVICLRAATWRLYPCDLWTGSRAGKGHGQHQVGKRWVYVHREALEKKLGRPIRPGMLACHHCDIKHCRQPEHLYEGTYLDNRNDALERGIFRGWYGRPAMTDQQKAEIRAWFATGTVTRAQIAARIGYSASTVGRVVASDPDQA